MPLGHSEYISYMNIIMFSIIFSLLFSTSMTLLPKTPSMKRKRPDVVKANEASDAELPMKLASTFMDGGKTKKLKIDDMSAIVEDIDSTLNDPSMLNATNNNTEIGSKRQLRTRKKKATVQPIKRSKRLANKTSDVSYLESPNTATKNKIVDTKNEVTTAKEAPSSSPKTLTSTMKTSPVTQVQPKIAVLIEKLQMSTQKYNIANYIDSPDTESGHTLERGNIKDIQMALFSADSENESPIKHRY